MRTIVLASVGMMVLGGGIMAMSACGGQPSGGQAAGGTKEAGEMKSTQAAGGTYVLGHSARLIDGTEVSLEQYKGKVVLIVNTASKCGFTAQYEDLEALYTKHKDAGLVVLGFPSNDFLGQEPGTNEQIAEFCRTEFGVTFPMFEKIAVKGDGAHPLYTQLAAQPEPIGGPPKWNFTKFVVDRSGNVVFRSDARMLSRTSLEKELVAKVEELVGRG